MVPQLREWVGGKQLNKFTEQSIKISNKDWESTIEITNKDRQRDKTGILQARMGDLATRAIAHDVKLVSAIINSGNSTTVTIGGGQNQTIAAYDGQPLFSASHKVGSQSLNNIVSYSVSGSPVGTAIGQGTTTAPSILVALLAVQAGLQQFYTFLDDRGEPINEMATDFVIHAAPSLAGVLEAAVNNAYPALGYSNVVTPMQGPSGNGLKINVVMNPRLTSSLYTTSFAIFRKNAPFRPFILQREYGPILKVLAEGSDYEFDNNAIKMSVEKRANVGIGRFDQAVLVSLTT